MATHSGKLADHPAGAFVLLAGRQQHGRRQPDDGRTKPSGAWAGLPAHRRSAPQPGASAAGERAQAFAAQSSANEQVFRAYKDQFDLNRRTLLDVLDSQNELFVARSNAINAQYLQMLAGYRLLARLQITP